MSGRPSLSQFVVFTSFRIKVAVEHRIVQEIEFLFSAVLVNGGGVVVWGWVVVGQCRLTGQFIRITNRRGVCSEMEVIIPYMVLIKLFETHASEHYP